MPPAPPLRTPAARAHHDAVVDEALPVPGGLQVRVLLRAGHLDAPDLAPGRVQREVDGVDAGVVRGHRVAAADRDPVLLQDSAGSSVVSGGRTRAAPHRAGERTSRFRSSDAVPGPAGDVTLNLEQRVRGKMGRERCPVLGDMQGTVSLEQVPACERGGQCTCSCTCVRVRVQVCECTRACMCMLCECVHTCTREFVCEHASVCVHTCVSVCI